MKNKIGIIAGLSAAMGVNDGKPLPIKVGPSKGAGRSRGRVRLGKYVPGQGQGAPKPTNQIRHFAARNPNESAYTMRYYTDGSLRLQ